VEDAVIEGRTQSENNETRTRQDQSKDARRSYAKPKLINLGLLRLLTKFSF
jgi:hypothetical protein